MSRNDPTADHDLLWEQATACAAAAQRAGDLSDDIAYDVSELIYARLRKQADQQDYELRAERAADLRSAA